MQTPGTEMPLNLEQTRQDDINEQSSLKVLDDRVGKKDRLDPLY
jgi:hypothetical protein